MDTIVLKESGKELIDPYRLTIILVQTKRYLTSKEMEMEDIIDLYELFNEHLLQMFLFINFTQKYINRESFDIFYMRSLEVMKDYPNTEDAKAYYVDWKKGA